MDHPQPVLGAAQPTNVEVPGGLHRLALDHLRDNQPEVTEDRRRQVDARDDPGAARRVRRERAAPAQAGDADRQELGGGDVGRRLLDDHEVARRAVGEQVVDRRVAGSAGRERRHHQAVAGEQRSGADRHVPRAAQGDLAHAAAPVDRDDRLGLGAAGEPGVARAARDRAREQAGLDGGGRPPGALHGLRPPEDDGAPPRAGEPQAGRVLRAVGRLRDPRSLGDVEQRLCARVGALRRAHEPERELRVAGEAVEDGVRGPGGAGGLGGGREEGEDDAGPGAGARRQETQDAKGPREAGSKHLPYCTFGGPPMPERHFVKYTFLKVDPAWRRLDDEERARDKRGVPRRLRGLRRVDGHLLRSFSLVGTRGDADLMLLSQARNLDHIHEFHVVLAQSGLMKWC